MNGEFKDVAKGKIITPLNRVSHGVRMPDDVFKVTLSRVLPGCGALDPPNQPPAADSELNLEQCLVWPLTWPKSLIRLETTPVNTPTPVHGSRHPSQKKDFSPAKSVRHDDDDAEDVNPNDYLVDDPYEGADLDDLDELLLPAEEADKYRCTNRLFSSQEPAAPEQEVISQDALKEAVANVFQNRPKKTTQKRTKKSSVVASMSQPVEGTKSKPPAQRVLDRIPIHDWHQIHELGKPMLPPRLASLLTGDMLSVHDGVQYMETMLLKEKYPALPVLVAKVPSTVGFVTEGNASKIIVRFDDIFRMFHMKSLHSSIVRLFTLSLAHQLSIENTKSISLVDPYYMHDMYLNNPKGRAKAAKYIKEVLLNNYSHKRISLLPYFPE